MINPNIRLNRFKVFPACLVAGVLSSAELPKADVLYLRQTANSEDVIAGLATKLAPAPVFENERGRFFYGKILAYRVGTHALPPNDASFDHVLFEAHGRNGANPSRKPVDISVRDIDWLVHEYDTLKDFVYQFSNRHELLETPFGSPLHRASLFRLFSPGDPRAMSGTGDAEISGDVREGTLTRFLISGPPSMDEMPLAGWSIHAPDYLFPGHYAGDIEGARFNEMWPNGTSALLLAMARAREYPTFDQDVGEMARDAAGIMCSMALQNSEIAIPPGMQVRARRARLMGTSCFKTITNALKADSEQIEYLVAGLHNGGDVMRVSLSNYVLAAVDLIESEPFFSRYVDPAQPLHDGLVYGPDRSGFLGDSRDIIRALADLAGGFSEASESDDVRIAAERVVIDMVAPGPSETREERRENELSRRNFRAALVSYADRFATSSAYVPDRPVDPRAENWLMGLYCRIGWGNHLDITAFAVSRISMATSLLRDVDGGAPDPGSTADAERYIRQVGLMQRTALSGGRTGMFLREAIDNKVAEIRESSQPYDKRFIQIFDGYMAEELDCEGYDPADH